MTSDYTPMPPPQSPQPYDRPGPGPVPRTVMNAVNLMYLIAGLGLISLIIVIADQSAIKDAIRKNDNSLTASQVNDRAHAAVIIGAVVGVIIVVLYVLLAIQVRKGKNWARIVTWVLSGLAVLGAINNLVTPQSSLTKILAGVELVVYLALIVFLASGPSKEYFRRARR